MACWAAELGECSDKSSREHLVSESLWMSDFVDVQGFSWCKDQPKRVGLGSFTAKILCTNHNNELSDVDTAGKIAFAAFRESMRLANVRKRQVPYRRWKMRRFPVSGPLLERWFLKTTINLACAQDSQLKWADTDAPISKPPLLLVEMAFGRRGIEKPRGLYGVAISGEKGESTDSVAFSPLVRHGTHVVGGTFTFRGQRFLLFVAKDEPPADFDLPGTSMRGWENNRLYYHVEKFQWQIGKSVSHRVEVNWPRAV